MVTLGVRGGQSIRRQVLRGIGFFAAGASALVAVGTLASWVHADDAGQAGLGRRLGATAVVLTLVAGGFVSVRRLRRWSERPGWLVPAVAALMLAASIPAVYAGGNGQYDGSCIPVLQAWQPSMTEPSAADVAYFESVLRTPLPHGRAALATFISAQQHKRRAPAFQRVDRYETWRFSEASCAPSSRSHLAWSAAGLGVGAAALTGALRRRRTG